MTLKGCGSVYIVSQTFPLVPIDAYPKVQQRDPRKSESWNDRHTLQQSSEVLIAITNMIPELMMSLPNGSLELDVYTGTVSDGGSVVENPAIVARSNSGLFSFEWEGFDA